MRLWDQPSVTVIQFFPLKFSYNPQMCEVLHQNLKITHRNLRAPPQHTERAKPTDWHWQRNWVCRTKSFPNWNLPALGRTFYGTISSTSRLPEKRFKLYSKSIKEFLFFHLAIWGQNIPKHKIEMFTGCNYKPLSTFWIWNEKRGIRLRQTENWFLMTSTTLPVVS